MRIRGNVEVETSLTGQTAAVLTSSDDSDQAGVTASMSRPTGSSDFDSQLLKAELERLLTMFESNKTDEGLMKAATKYTATEHQYTDAALSVLCW